MIERETTRTHCGLRAAIATVMLLGAVGSARADGLDGVWKRDDGKTYLICAQDGVSIESGSTPSHGCRLRWTWTPGQPIEMRLRFTRTTDEGGFFETTATSTETLQSGPFPDRLRMKFEWVDLDDDGNVTDRGFESRVLERTAPVEESSRAATLALLAAHREADDFLDPRGGHFDRALARKILEDALRDPACRNDPSLDARRRALAGAGDATAASSRAIEPASPEAATAPRAREPVFDASLPTATSFPIAVRGTTIPLVETADASIGYAIRIPGDALATRRDGAHTYTVVLADGVSELSITIFRGGAGSLDQLVEEATLFGTPDLVEKRQLPSGLVLVVKASEVDGLSQQVWASRKSATHGVTVECTGPASEVQRMLAICASLECRETPAPPASHATPGSPSNKADRGASAVDR